MPPGQKSCLSLLSDPSYVIFERVDVHYCSICLVGGSIPPSESTIEKAAFKNHNRFFFFFLFYSYLNY